LLNALFWCDCGAKTRYLVAKWLLSIENAEENAIKNWLNASNFVENQFLSQFLDSL